MKHTIYRMIAMLLVVCCCLTCLSLTAYAEPEDDDWTYDDEPEETEPVVETQPEEVGAFTPNGNLTLIDDYYKIEGVDENGNVASKQFLTLQSKNGNYFYLVIDRFGTTENVYFLNLVDEADLMALIDGEETPSPVQCTCTERCKAGSVNTACPVCKQNMTECAGKETPSEVTEATEPIETTQPTAPAKQQTTAFPAGMIVFVIGIVAVVGAVFFVKAKKKKNAVADPDGFDVIEEKALIEETDEQEG